MKKIIRGQIPYVEEGCFLDEDYDYMEEKIPFGYPVYPCSDIKRKSDEEDMAGTDGRHYFYAVKKGIENPGLYEELQEAFKVAYINGASCRRFIRKEAAEEYLERQ